MRVFVALLSSLEFHTFPSACQVPLANPILLSTSLSDPSCQSCVLIFPPRYTKFSVCSNSCPSTSRRNFLFPSPRNWHSVFCMLIFIPIFLLTCATLICTSTCSVIPFPAPRVERCHPQISNLLSFHLRCQPLRLIHPVPLP